MTATNTASILLALDLGNERDLGELNDWAVNTVRDYCRERGYSAPTVVAEEEIRIRQEGLGLQDYTRARRIGSRFRLTRTVRRAVWTLLATRKALVAA